MRVTSVSMRGIRSVWNASRKQIALAVILKDCRICMIWKTKTEPGASEVVTNSAKKICGWIMDEPFKEYQEEANDQHAAFYVVFSDGECEYGMTIGEKSEEKAKKIAFKNCEKWRKENNIAGTCEPFAVNDKILWEDISFVTNDEGESEYDDSADMVEYEYRTCLLYTSPSPRD